MVLCVGAFCHVRVYQDGNQAHRSPELVSAVRSTMMSPSAAATTMVSLEKQPSFAVGVLLYEIATAGQDPLFDYPSGFTRGSEVMYEEEDIEDGIPVEFPSGFKTVVRGLLSHDAETRLSLTEAESALGGLSP